MNSTGLGRTVRRPLLAAQAQVCDTSVHVRVFPCLCACRLLKGVVEEEEDTCHMRRVFPCLCACRLLNQPVCVWSLTHMCASIGNPIQRATAVEGDIWQPQVPAGIRESEVPGAARDLGLPDGCCFCAQ